jgi:hypothetical protein
MKNINERTFEEIVGEIRGRNYKPNRSEHCILRAYEISKECGYEWLVITEGPWDCEDEEIHTALADLGVDSFVLADHSTALLNMIHVLYGAYEINGLAEISQEGKPYYRPDWDKPLKGLMFAKV